jgi:DNA-binding FadR family transcriptional regulator
MSPESTDPRLSGSGEGAATIASAVALGVHKVQSSYLQVADQLRDLILRGELVPGQRLPSEDEMAPMFGVSRSTVREALRILVTQGLVVTRRGVYGGTFIADVDPAQLEGVVTSTLTVLARTDHVGVVDFLEAWQALEVPAAGLAARRRGGDLLAELEATSVPLSDRSPIRDRMAQSGRFHSAILEASGNVLLAALGRPVSDVARVRFATATPSGAFYKTNSAEHRRIFEAIAAGDEAGARNAATEHVASLMRSYSPDEATLADVAARPTRKKSPT